MRQRRHDDAVPQQDLHQDRHVPGELDVAVDHPVDQPVAGQPQHAEGEAEDGREDAAGNGDKAGVDEPDDRRAEMGIPRGVGDQRSEEHTSELQSLMRISYAVFRSKKKNYQNDQTYVKQMTTTN